MEEIKQDFLIDLGLPNDFKTPTLDKLIRGESRYIKDLRVNLKNVLKSDHLNLKEAYLVALCVAYNQKNGVLIDVFEKKAKENEATEADLAETLSVASLLAGNNILYRFRHFVGKESYNKFQARIKMLIMARPVMGKEFFELLSLVVSAVNGCESCVGSHEESVTKMESSEERVFDAIRIGTVIASLDRIIY